MSGFEAWAASFYGTMAVAACALVAGMILGWLAGTRPRGLSRRERRELADRAAARAASRFRAMRETGLAGQAPHAVRQPRKRSPLARSGPVQYLDGLEGMTIGAVDPLHITADTPIDYGQWEDGKPWHTPRPPEVAHEWEPAHVGAALAVANGDPITTGEIRAITEDMDVFMARLLGEHPVPYPDGSGQ